jgi:hypothetical protein
MKDELVNRMILQKRLKKDGHEVVVAVHGGDAVRVFEQDPHFDLILMDLKMPVRSLFCSSRSLCSIGQRALLSLADHERPRGERGDSQARSDFASAPRTASPFNDPQQSYTHPRCHGFSP